MMVDHNNGQLDIYEPHGLSRCRIWSRCSSRSDGRRTAWTRRKYDGVYAALEAVPLRPAQRQADGDHLPHHQGPRRLSDFLNRHKVAVADCPDRAGNGAAIRAARRARRGVQRLLRAAGREARTSSVCRTPCSKLAERHAPRDCSAIRRATCRCDQSIGPVVTRARSAARQADSVTMRRCCRGSIRPKEYSASDIVTAAMKVFARDPAVVSIDSDLATTSGLEAGVGAVDQSRALNVGVAEANMMVHRRGVRRARLQRLDQHVLPVLRLEGAAPHRGRPSGAARGDGGPRRLAERGPRARSDVAGHRRQFRNAHQRRHAHGQRRHHGLRRHRPPEDHRRLLPAADAGDHAVDHGGQSRAGLRARDAHAVRRCIYGPDYRFEFGKGHVCGSSAEDAAVIVSSGRGVHEALAAASAVRKSGRRASAWWTCRRSTTSCCCELFESGKPLVFAEQNNGYIWQNFLKVLYRHRKESPRTIWSASSPSTRSTPKAGRSSSTPAPTRN